MKSFRLRVLRVVWLLLSLVCTVQADTLIAKVLYDVKASCNGKVTPAVKATAVPTTATCYKNVACDVVDKMYSATYCPTTDATGGSWISSDFDRYFLEDIFGRGAEIAIVKTYQAGQACTFGNLTAITVYIADNQCHKTGATSSYIAVSALYGSAVKKFSATSDCTGASTAVSQTYDELVSGSCTGTKVSGSEGTTVYLSTVALYDTKDGDCQPRAVPTKVVSQVVEASCTSAFHNNCSGAGVPYTSTACSTFDELFQCFYSSFGYGSSDKHPIVFLWEYVAGKSCAATDLSGVTVYLADKKCHKTGKSASFRATRSIDGAVTIKTYATADCSGNEATNVDWDVAKATGNTCVDGADGVVDTLVGGWSATPLYLELAATFSKNTDECTSPGIPILLESTTVEVDACKVSGSCTAAGSLFTRTLCSSSVNIQDDAAAIFGRMPFVIVEAFHPGKSCAPAELDNITIYLADGRCHKTGDSTSYVATRTKGLLLPGSDDTITTYTDAVCTPDKEELELPITARQEGENSCGEYSWTGILDKLIYGGGYTPLYLQSTATFESGDNHCVSPIYLDTTVVGTNACTASEDCTAAGDLFTGTLCSSTATFKDDAVAAFHSTPFVVVETFTAGADCATTSLTSIKTYTADLKCHATGAGVPMTKSSTVSESHPQCYRLSCHSIMLVARNPSN
ncbi:hypothetical protein PF005_g28891 [Phytophthora fragariae]|uniref:Ig-like domain-containing protein n=2 Tax=Phytophthora fragariae TaxID=53985 RepID=A0A6A3QDQ7_9STRA|nr:hypothetical protein PF003_g28158 [Phytophthora fragariae]KAE9074293.1 hypothetical protein PF006_g28574 [Phytophthora fragariae]KAE9167166.1 hypothetical protein PF005_g28891 [Phytophthora fragariae]KAE9172644.1 hypothetical protein PF002_g29516 [Phytophthora fragariae]